MDIILIPITYENNNSDLMECQNLTSYRKDSMNIMISDSSRTNKEINIENLFPSPGVIIKDTFELYKLKKPIIKERESALIDYIKVLFSQE